MTRPAHRSLQPSLGGALSFAFAAFAIAPFALRAQPAFAPSDDDPVLLERFVVTTATRTEKAIEKIPGAVELITGRELETQSLIAEDPSQALAYFVPGFAPSRQKLTQTGESLRGRPVLYLLDGIPQSNPVRAGMREGYFADSLIVDRSESPFSGRSVARRRPRHFVDLSRLAAARKGQPYRAAKYLRLSRILSF